MKREIKIEIKDDLNHYALIKQKNNRERETDYGMLIDKDQYEQLRQHFVSEMQPTTPHLSAEEIFKKYCFKVHGEYILTKPDAIKAMHEYRSQPTSTPEISAEEYADNAVTDYKQLNCMYYEHQHIDAAIIDITNTITALELAGVDATYYKQALEYLKGR